MIPPKTPQMNGLAERMNRSLVEKVQCSLSIANLPRSFWVEALYVVPHVINRTPIVDLQADVPDKMWYGKDISFDHYKYWATNVLYMYVKMKDLCLLPR